MRIKWLRPALKDIDNIAEFIAQDNKAAAEKTVGLIYHSIKNLEIHPSLGKAGRVAGTRELIIPGTRFIVPYRVKENEIQILRVFHTARKYPENISELP